MLIKFAVFICILFASPLFAQNQSSVVNDGYGDYVLVPAGEFKMGDNFNEDFADSRPVHTVYLDSFYIGKYEVTNAEYSKFVADSGYSDSLNWTYRWYKNFGSKPRYWNDSLYFGMRVRGGGIQGNENFPVVGVSRYEAEAYCNWLSKKTGKTYRLPTEAEWEKAARGTDQRRFPWGNDIDGHYANYKDSGDPYDNGLTVAGYFDGSSHDSYETKSNASPYKAYDMAGNVHEWVSDWYDESYYAGSPSNNPKGSMNLILGPDGGFYGIIRGGSSGFTYHRCRSANRFVTEVTFRPYETGFRCVREVSYEEKTNVSENNNGKYDIPGQFNLEQNYPNPFNPITTIQFQVPRLTDATIKIYSMLGQEVKTVISKQLSAGIHEVQWDGTDNLGQKVSSGIYIYRMETNTGYMKTRKMVYLK